MKWSAQFKCFTKCSLVCRTRRWLSCASAGKEGKTGFGGNIMKKPQWKNKPTATVSAVSVLVSRYMRVISSHFPRYTIASLRQVGVSSLTPLLCERMPVNELLETECDTHYIYIYILGLKWGSTGRGFSLAKMISFMTCTNLIDVLIFCCSPRSSA